jgi:glycosyltransferase involved in cell wall biosynthesis
LFDRLDDDWQYTLVAADRSLLSRKRAHKTSGSFRAVWTTPYRGNGIDRIVNWCSYSIGAFIVGLRQRRLDVVYASSPHLLAGVVGYALARIRRAGFVLEIRDLWPRILVDMGHMKPTSMVYRLVRQLELFLYRHAGEIVVLAEGSAESIRKDCPEGTAITFVPNGSDPATFEVAETRTALRNRHGLSGLVFVYAGAHNPANGLNLVLDAAERIRADLPEVSFVLVGDGLEKPTLMADAARRGLSNVRFLDPIPRSDIAGLFAAADVGLHVLADVPLFRYGVSPNKLYDYMAAGLPVVSNSPGEVGGTIDRTGAGLAVGPDDLDKAVRRMAAASDDERRVWGEAGKHFIDTVRSHEILAVQLAEVLERAVKA